MAQTIIFDFDGTIVNTLEATVEVYNRLAPRFYCKPVSPNDLERLRDGRPKELMAEFGVKAWNFPLFLNLRKESQESKDMNKELMDI